jgi:glycosyltransferase involved in cell wall biosynthesis/SAM-dependent methyltransferase
MSDPAPRVSILIPNYNNGKASSIDSKTDLIADLLQSLHDTLHDDPTPLQIIAYDDGSTDDSLDTLRSWSKKSWRNGQPFLKLIEAEHTGILSIGANRLVRESTGDILVRLDGDTVMLTLHWASLLTQTFDQGHPRLGVLGPKQLRPNGEIHAFGDWLLHPKGYHHLLSGADRYAINHALEVDHVMGCFYCCKRAVYDDVGGYDENILRGQTIDFGLAARLKGWSCFAIPHIEYTHRHGLRGARKTTADTDQGVRQTLDTFREKWGFDRIAPDLDVVREKYAGTPLLWNAQVFATPPPKPIPADTSLPDIDIELSQWTRYGQDADFRQSIDIRAAVALQVMSQLEQPNTDKPKKIALLGCDTGLTAHLLAGQGLSCIGTDTDPAKISLAKQCVIKQTYSAGQPQFLHQLDPRKAPLDDESIHIALLFDQMESHDNPVALIRDTHRFLADDGLLVILTKRPEHTKDPFQSQRRYKAHQLMIQLQAVGGWATLSDPKQGNPEHPLIVIARKVPLPEHTKISTNPNKPSPGPNPGTDPKTTKKRVPKPTPAEAA